ncbi:hypothetical protein RE476_10940 [Methanolobus mangrovi]|uniref:Uncharacterized protein n=1 Tax=Methanolobus mangrovi TaxID=3072977 RepID=A0AA51UF92_9EURY|nr:hypothetical protein [Methanolobus mangrovi]WMW21878.1 hypothetical protein RE476_10940 [Methanolobus mangrovi]
MAKTIAELENDLDVMNEMFRKYVKVSLNYQLQIKNAEIPEEQRKALMEKLAVENAKVQKAKEQMKKFEQTIKTLKMSNQKLKEVVSGKETPAETSDYLVAYI